MRGKDLIEDIGKIDDKFIEEASQPMDLSKVFKTKKRNRLLKQIIPLAGAAVIFLICIGVYNNNFKDKRLVMKMASNGGTETIVEDVDTNLRDQSEPVFEMSESSRIAGGEETEAIVGAVNNEEGMLNSEEAANEAATSDETKSDTKVDMQIVQISPPNQSTDIIDNSEAAETEIPRLIKIKGVLYYDSASTTNEITCGVMDGYIDSSCEGEPQEDGQSNFGTGYGYQFGKSCINVYIDNEWCIFYPYVPGTVYETQENTEIK